jgi:hypothetical protein
MYIPDNYFMAMDDDLTDGEAQVKIKEKHFKSQRLDTSYSVERAAENIKRIVSHINSKFESFDHAQDRSSKSSTGHLMVETDSNTASVGTSYRNIKVQNGGKCG